MEREGASVLRPLKPEDIRCPAGDLVNEASCLCKIEGGVIEGRLQPTTIEGLCAGAYEVCSTWMAAKKVEEKGGDLRKIIESQQAENSRRRSRSMLREARLRRAQKLMSDPGPEGKRFRRHLRVGEFAHLAQVVEEG